MGCCAVMAATSCSGTYRLHLATSILLLFFSINTTHSASATTNKLFRTFPGIDVISPCFDVIPYVSTVSKCVSLCQLNAPRCQSGSYHVTRRTCCLCDVTAFYYNVSFLDDPDGVFFQDVSLSLDIVHSGWTMVFRATAGTNTRFMTIWNDMSRHDDWPLGNSDLQLGCMTLNGSLPCRSHFRSQYLDLWGTLNVQEVSLRLYNQGTEKINVLFNGTGSNVTSWMTQQRMLSSPWSDATPTSNYHSCSINSGSRRFYINKNAGGCPNDEGWLVAREATPTYNCAWENGTGSQPLFIYSAINTSIKYNDWPNGGVAAADVLAIFIKY